MLWKMTDKGGKNARYYRSSRSAFLRAAERIVSKGSVELEEINGVAKFAAGTVEGEFKIWGSYTHSQFLNFRRAWNEAKQDQEAAV